MAYSVYRALGVLGIREALRCGTGRLARALPARDGTDHLCQGCMILWIGRVRACWFPREIGLQSASSRCARRGRFSVSSSPGPQRQVGREWATGSRPSSWSWWRMRPRSSSPAAVTAIRRPPPTPGLPGMLSLPMAAAMRARQMQPASWARREPATQVQRGPKASGSARPASRPAPPERGGAVRARCYLRPDHQQQPPDREEHRLPGIREGGSLRRLHADEHRVPHSR